MSYKLSYGLPACHCIVFIVSYSLFPEYTHIIALGANDISHFFSAVSRYQLGQLLQEQGAFGDDVYEDPVPFNQVFEIVDGTPQINVELLVSVSYNPGIYGGAR